jgi:uncharacterized protein YdaU (DUF1376 family)
MPRTKSPAPTPTAPKKPRAVDPEIQAAKEALAIAKEAAKDRVKAKKVAKLQEIQAALNDKLDKIEAEIQRLS